MSRMQRVFLLGKNGGAPPPTYVASLYPINNRGSLPANPVSSTGSGRTGSDTQVQQKIHITAMRSGARFKIRLANDYGNGTSLSDGSGSVTMRAGWSTVPIYFGGVRDVVVAPGAVVESDWVSSAVVKGNVYDLIIRQTFGAVQSSWAGAVQRVYDYDEFQEFGTALADRTTTSWTSGTRYVDNMMPPIVDIVTDTPQTGPAVILLGDSISSQGANDSTFVNAFSGYMQRILADRYPWANVGASGLQLDIALHGQKAKRIDRLAGRGFTHCICPLGANDIGAGFTSAQFIANLQLAKTIFDAMGIRFIPCTLTPRTNGTNDGENSAGGSGQWTRISEINTYIRNNDGVGYGYIDVNAVCRDATNANIWRTDLGTPHTDGIHPETVIHSRLVTDVAAWVDLALSAVPANTMYGVYHGNGPDGGDISSFERMTNRITPVVLDFYSQGSWDDMQGDISYTNGYWQDKPQYLELSVPLSMSGSTLAQVAAGMYDTNFQNICDDLIARKMARRVIAIRLAWEMNGGWYQYCVPANGTMAEFVAAYQRIARLFQNSGFKIHWCPNIGYGQNPPEQYYPGDSYVDYVGIDAYAQRYFAYNAGYPTDDNQMWILDELGYGASYVSGATDHGLIWLAEFAAAHNKPIIIGEAGTGYKDSAIGRGGLDSAYYMTQFYAWCAANHVLLLNVWDYPAKDYWGRMSLSSSVTGIVPPSQYADVFDSIGTFGPWDEKPLAAAAFRRVLAGTPDIVTGVTVGTPTSTTIPVSWSAVSGATGYTVEGTLNNGASWTTLLSVGSGTLSTSLTGLTAATLYKIRVAALNANGHGGYGVASATTAAASSIFDAAHKTTGTGSSPTVNLTNGNLTATKANSGSAIARVTTAIPSGGMKCVRFRIDGDSGTSVGVGAVTSSFPTDGSLFLGQNAQGACAYASGDMYCYSSSQYTFPVCSVGDWIWLAVDDAGKLYVARQPSGSTAALAWKGPSGTANPVAKTGGFQMVTTGAVPVPFDYFAAGFGGSGGAAVTLDPNPATTTSLMPSGYTGI